MRYGLGWTLAILVVGTTAGDAHLRHKRDAWCAPLISARQQYANYSYTCHTHNYMWMTNDGIRAIDFYGYTNNRPFRVQYEHLKVD